MKRSSPDGLQLIVSSRISVCLKSSHIFSSKVNVQVKIAGSSVIGNIQFFFPVIPVVAAETIDKYFDLLRLMIDNRDVLSFVNRIP